MTEYRFDDFRVGKVFSVTLDNMGLVHEILMEGWVPETRRRERCLNRAPEEKWCCTLKKGHTGYHVGHTTREVVGVWENDDVEMEEEDEDEVTPVAVEEGEAYDPMGWLDTAKEDEE